MVLQSTLFSDQTLAMVRRTRACQACYTRRIRCDETHPHCHQCIRAGRQCPGPVEGPLIINVTSETVARSRAQSSRYLVRPCQNSTALMVSPSQTPILVQNFLFHFLDYFANRSSGAPGRFWLYQLPSMPMSGKENGLELAIQATSTAFCANDTDNPDYHAGSREMYGQALKTHSRSVAGLQGSLTPTPQMLCTTLILAFYEAINSTQSEGYIRHVEGAAKMVEIMGPEGCRDGLVNELFFTARTQMLLVTFLTRKHSLYASQPYLEIPYLGEDQPIHERLMNIITLLTEELNHPSRTNITNQSYDPTFLTTADSIIDDLWLEFYSLYWRPLSDPKIEGPAPSEIAIYPSAFAAYITTYFSLSRIFHALIIERQNIFPNRGQQYAVFQASTSILSCAAYLEQQNLGCAYIRAILPLLVVALHGTSEEQKVGARVVLERWGERGMVKGLVGLALRRVRGGQGPVDSSLRVQEVGIEG